MKTDYLNFSRLAKAEYDHILQRAGEIKAAVRRGERTPYLAARLLLMIFEKPSTRTRTSFLAAMVQAGGGAGEVRLEEAQLARGESFADTIRALAAYADAIVYRTTAHRRLAECAQAAACPVINGLSDESHPCQVLSDILTYTELRGDLRGRRLAWIGDCNNMAYSWSEAAEVFGCEFVVSCPAAYRRALPGRTTVFAENPAAAATGADAVMTDVWTSMGDGDESQRESAFADYRITESLMRRADKAAVFMHCLPAHRGKEVSAEVLDGEQSVVLRQMENRLHAQKALLIYLINGKD